MARILIADDHAVVRRGLRSILLEHADLEVPEGAADYDEVFQRVGSEPWDALLLDIQMPGGNVLDALGRLARVAPDLPVLILSSHPEDQFAVRMIQAGAAGYLTKSSAADELSEAVRTVLRGRKYVSPEMASRLAEALGGGGGRPRHDQLSDREFQVLQGIASGRTVSQIADALHLSVKTVSTYRRRVLDKLELSTNAELTRYALERDLA